MSSERSWREPAGGCVFVVCGKTGELHLGLLLLPKLCSVCRILLAVEGAPATVQRCARGVRAFKFRALLAAWDSHSLALVHVGCEGILCEMNLVVTLTLDLLGLMDATVCLV